jgi:hypothetical protein
MVEADALDSLGMPDGAFILVLDSDGHPDRAREDFQKIIQLVEYEDCRTNTHIYIPHTSIFYIYTVISQSTPVLQSALPKSMICGE